MTLFCVDVQMISDRRAYDQSTHKCIMNMIPDAHEAFCFPDCRVKLVLADGRSVLECGPEMLPGPYHRQRQSRNAIVVPPTGWRIGVLLP